MARGRMISASLGSSRKYRRLTAVSAELGEFAQALFPLLIVAADDFGLLEADAETVKMKVFPGSSRNEQEFQAALDLLSQVNLVLLYEAAGDKYLQIVHFEDHQSGLHKRTKPRFPMPPPGNSRKVPEVPPEEKGTEQKGTEGKKESPPIGGRFPTFFDVGVGILMTAGETEPKARAFLGMLAKEKPKAVMAEAVAKLSAAGPVADPKAYIRGVLKAMAKTNGGISGNDLTPEQRERAEAVYGGKNPPSV